MPFVRAGTLIAFSAALCCLFGCSPSLSEVTGKVSFDGKLVEDGAIRFEPVDGQGNVAGDTIKGGAYSARMAPGTYKVSFSVSKTVGKKALYDKPDGPFMDVKIDIAPEKYKRDTSQEQLEVKPGVNKKDWDLVP